MGKLYPTDKSYTKVFQVEKLLYQFAKISCWPQEETYLLERGFDEQFC